MITQLRGKYANNLFSVIIGLTTTCADKIKILTIFILFIKLNLPVFQLFSRSCRHPLTLTSPGYWATLGNQRVQVSLGKQFHFGFCVQTTYGAQEHQSCTYTTLSGYQFTPRPSGTSEIHPEKFMLGQCRIQPHLSICSRTRYHWTNTPHLQQYLRKKCD